MTTTSPAQATQPRDDDERRLAELGYKQELRRKWSGFSNFAISFSIISIYFIMPISPAGVPFSEDFSWAAVNYAPIAVGGVLVLVALWWVLSARHWFTGPRRTVDSPAE